MSISKRQAKTSNEQYQIYLDTLDNDEVFKTGVVNPNMDPNYIKKKWAELAVKLNSCGSGPQLTVKRWDKRFQWWKCVTRRKYSEYLKARNCTGDGPSPKQLTPLEKRAVDIWGRVVVNGAQNMMESGFQYLEPPNEGNSVTPNSFESINIDDMITKEEVENDEILNRSSQKKRKRRKNDLINIYETKMDEQIAAMVKKNELMEELLSLKKKKYEDLLRLEQRKIIIEERKIKIEERKINIEERKLELQEKNYIK